jgi:hypothetical protein
MTVAEMNSPEQVAANILSQIVHEKEPDGGA